MYVYMFIQFVDEKNDGFGFFCPTQKNDSIGMTKRSYLEAVIEGLKSVTAVDVAFMPHDADAGIGMDSALITNTCNGTARKSIYVRLLLSIDRRETTEAAMETVSRKMRSIWK